MSRFWKYPATALVLIALSVLGYLFAVPYARTRYAGWRHARDVTNFVACVDKGTNGLVIVDAGGVDDGVGVYVSAVYTNPGQEQLPERSSIGATAEITYRRFWRLERRSAQRWSVVFRCYLDKIPWGGYFKVNIIDVVPHYGWRYGRTDMTGAVDYQVIFRERADMEQLHETCSAPYAIPEMDATKPFAPSTPCGELFKKWIVDERIVVVDFAAVKAMGGNMEIPAGIFTWKDLPQRTIRIAKLLSGQDTAETPLETP